MKMKTSYDKLQEMTKRVVSGITFSDMETVSDTAGVAIGNWMVEFDSFDTVVFDGEARFVRYFGDWKDEQSHYRPTVADALKAMGRSMEALNDFHHIFYEGVGVEVQDDGTAEIEIITGS